MITLTAKINLLSGDNKALSFGSTNLSGNNISCDYNAIMGVKKKVSNPAIIGASKIGDGSTIANNEVDFFIGNQLSNEIGRFEVPYGIEINSKTPIKNLTVSFDTVNNRHPKSIKAEKAVSTFDTLKEIGKVSYTGSISQDYFNNSENKYVYLVRILVPMSMFPEQWSEYSNLSVDQVSSIVAEKGLVDAGGVPVVLENFKGYVDEPRNLIMFTCRFNSDYKEYTREYEFTVDFTISHQVPSIDFEHIGDFVDDDAIWTITLPEETTSINLVIENWNTPNYPLILSGIYTEVAIEIDRRNMASIESEILDRSDLKLPSFGVFSNKGNIEFIDSTGEIKDYAEDLLLQSGLSCVIQLNNTLVKNANEVVGVFETDEWDYNNDNRTVSVSLKDELVEWQNINVPEISYNPNDLSHKPFSWFYEKLWKITKQNYNMLSFEELDESTKNVLKNTYTKYPLLKSGSLWSQWTKICEVCQLHIYKNGQGIIVCKYNGGN